MPDPKLIAAMEEVKVVLRKHDLAAFVILQSPDYAEHLLELTPSWSCAVIEEGGIRVRCKKEEIPDEMERKRRIENTISMFFGFQKTAERMIENMASLLGVLSHHFEINFKGRHERR